jgi:hypothetical protein
MICHPERSAKGAESKDLHFLPASTEKFVILSEAPKALSRRTRKMICHPERSEGPAVSPGLSQTR